MARKVSCVLKQCKSTNCDINYTRMFQILLETVPYRQWIIVRVRGWEAFAEFWYGTSRPNSWLGFSTSRLQKRED